MATVLNPNAAEDEPLRINLDETPPVAAAEAAPAPPAPATTPPAAIDDLKRQLQEAARYRDQQTQAMRALAQQRDQQAYYAQQQAAVAAQAQERGILADEVIVENRTRHVTEQLESMKEAQATAYSAGEWDKVADLNVKIGRLSGEMAVLEQKTEYLQGQRQQYLAYQQAQQQRAQQPQPQPRPQVSADPFERALAGRTEPTQKFLRAHRDLVRSDGSLKKVAVEAHERALDEGLRVDTEDYFKFIEQNLGDDRSRAVKGTSARPKGPPTVAASVSRSAVGHQGGTEYVMSPTLRQHAIDQLGPGNEAEWFDNYVRLIREGKIDPIE